jgi:hypothetical protein
MLSNQRDLVPSVLLKSEGSLVLIRKMMSGKGPETYIRYNTMDAC